MADFERNRIEPIELINSYWPEASTEHITFDPYLKNGQYNIIRKTGHDGTLTFTIEMLQEVLLNIVNKTSYYKFKHPLHPVKDVKYTIGKIRHARVYGDIELKLGKRPGLMERASMPVICDYVY